MIDLPDPSKAFDYENGFYLTCNASRLAKMLAHYELFRKTLDVPGAIVECGVFKGASLIRFAIYRQLLMTAFAKKIIGFDTFGDFPLTEFAGDVAVREKFIQSAGSESISRDQLTACMEARGLGDNVELIRGDITKTLPAYIEVHPQLRISLLNLDTDVYEPAVTILECLYPRVVRGGIVLLDDYGVFPGETQAVDEYFAGTDIRIQKLPFAQTPCYIAKE